MERFVQNVKYFAAAVVNGVSAVCSGVVATGVTSGLNLESVSSLGFFLSPLIPTKFVTSH
ncbi:hypothetical protein WKW71_19470 [Vibrio alginolyticus]|uniref:hypothetical protein n=1 Tax=Vibrio alginolyticus TaxID=663 RepID=UPI001BD41E68|nr:hypothetical protein [Vibrio alginolyticus]ELI1835926.1 hypothetical protein [Vibrio alginolyticus]MBT0059337.1 hypothetical protein [Vibrio alginolyticus]MCR9521565.1 hypothetical protein [Vibrio alginolyticus]